MSDQTNIEWTATVHPDGTVTKGATWNPTTGCTKVSPGCAHCYIERTPAFRIHGRRFVDGHIPLKLHADRLDQPLHWRKPRRVFVNSLSDLFHDDVPDTFIERVFSVMALAERHTFQLLTKRPARMRAWFRARRFDVKGCAILQTESGECQYALPWPLPNVWLGVSVENQHFADARIPLLLQTPAAVRFISAEPLLGPVDLTPFLGPRCDICGGTATCFGVYEVPEDEARYACDHCCGHGNEDGWCKPVSDGGIAGTPRGLDWVIGGGESGKGARPFNLAWARSLVNQCQAAGVPVFVKQLGDYAYDGAKQSCDAAACCVHDYAKLKLHRKGGDPAEWPRDLRIRQFPAMRETTDPRIITADKRAT